MTESQRFHDRVELELDGSVAIVRLVHGERRNAIDLEMALALRDATDAAVESPGARAILVVPEGPALTVGGDIRAFVASDDLPALLQEMIAAYHASLATLAEAEVPVVCAMRGAAAGGGLGLAWSADFVLASTDTKLALGFLDIGLTSDGANSWFLPRLIGPRRAAELMLGGRVLSAAEALEWGLVNRVVEDADLDREASTLAAELATKATKAYGVVRRLLRTSWDESLAERLQTEREEMAAIAGTEDAREGLTAFLERRPPRFTGH